MDSNNIRIVAFGDSLTYGHGIESKEQQWTNILQRELGIEVINAGVNGNTSREGLERIERDVLAYKPNYVIVNFGMNDHFMNENFKPKTSLEDFKRNLIKIIELIRVNGGEPLLIAPHKILEGAAGDSEGLGATYYYGRYCFLRYKEVGGANTQLRRYCKAIKEAAEQTETNFLDMYVITEGLNPHSYLLTLENSSKEDGVHINPQGARLYAEEIGKALLKLMNENNLESMPK